MKFLDFMGESPSGVKCRHAQNEWAVIHRLEIGLKCSQGSETLFGTGVNYLLGQATGQREEGFPAHFEGQASGRQTLVGNRRW
jgi:hypothetical protein